jgi:ubiquinone/menaquinone biosynthesis C-methylase UbiE
MKKGNITSIMNCYNKLSNFGKILIFIILLLLLITFFKSIIPNQTKVTEGFIQKDDYVFLQDADVFDEFYAKLYDYLVFNDVKTDFEIGNVVELVGPTNQAIILDVGSGTGHHVDMLSKKPNVTNVVGVDVSPSMIAQSTENYPKHKWLVGDVLNLTTFPASSFTHITCFYFTIYYFKEKRRFFENCMEWLMPGGYLVVHLVNREKFDPILPPGNPLYIVSPQKYAKKRITTTKVNFKDFVYNSNFNLDGEIATFDEKFKFKDGKVRQQQQTLYMEDTESILTTAQQCGFNLYSIIDMVKCAYEYQYLYVFVKPT